MLCSDELRSPETDHAVQSSVGWTRLHSWIFIIIVAVGVAVLVMQNRYHYLSPLGLGKAYRIDKLFGGIQEFDPFRGWITAQLSVPPPSPAMSMMEPPGSPVGSQAVPMNMPVSPPAAESPTPAVPDKALTEKPASPILQPTPTMEQAPPAAAKEAPELSNEEKFARFQKLFPNFGQDEFQLANDDLYPDWKANVSKSGNWDQFLTVYHDFVQWWLDAGSPPEPGFKLWKQFLASYQKAQK